MTRVVGLVVSVLVLAATAGCGDGSDPAEAAVPRPVPDGLVRDSVAEKYSFHESDLPVHETFAEAGPDSLAADGRLWELRKADRLVGVLQLTTVLPEADLHDSDVRGSFVSQLLPTGRDRFDLGDVAIWSTESSGKTSYLWFAEEMFVLFTVKPGSHDDDLIPERALDQILDHMVAADAWEYLYIDDESAEE